MRKTIWSPRFFGTTRGHILKRLCVAKRTVSELARPLRLTKNAVRAHLAALQRDGLVVSSGIRRAVRRPEVAYDLTPRGQQLFPKAYGPLLNQLWDILSQRLSADAATDLMKEAGERFVRRHLPGSESDSPQATLSTVMRKLSSVAELEESGDRLLIRGCGCPVAMVVKSHPEACQIAAGLLSGILGRPVRERCNRGAASPHCCFVLE